MDMDLLTHINKPFGTRSYTLIMWCPSLTAMYGSGFSGGFTQTTKIGGLCIQQSDSMSA